MKLTNQFFFLFLSFLVEGRGLTATSTTGGVAVLYLEKGSSPPAEEAEELSELVEGEGVIPVLEVDWAAEEEGVGACAGRAGAGPPFLGGGGGFLEGPLFEVGAAEPEDCPLAEGAGAPAGIPWLRNQEI